MIDASNFAFVCYPVSDMARSRKFYEGVLGLKLSATIETQSGPWTEYAFGDSKLVLWQSDLLSPVEDGVVAAIEVNDFDEAMSSLNSAGVEFLIDPIETNDSQRAVIVDPDGSRICIHKSKEEAS